MKPWKKKLIFPSKFGSVPLATHIKRQQLSIYPTKVSFVLKKDEVKKKNQIRPTEQKSWSQKCGSRQSLFEMQKTNKAYAPFPHPPKGVAV